MTKRKLNIILEEKFPNVDAICVMTGINLKYIKSIGLSLAWKLNLERARNYSKIIIVGSDKGIGIDYQSPLNNIDTWSSIPQRGNFLLAEMTEVLTVKQAKEMYQSGNPHSLWREMNDRQSYFHENWLSETIDEDNDNKRLIFIFKKETIKEGNLNEQYRGLAMPAFYIPKV